MVDPIVERRSRVMTDEDIRAIVEATVEALNCGSFEEYREHHRLIGAWLKREEKRAALREKIAAQVGGWGVVIVLSWIGFTVWEAFKAAVQVKSGGNGQ